MEVWCAFNQTNVWVCLQTQPKPDDSALMLSYAFENSKHWAPLFAESDYETYFKDTDGKVLPLIFQSVDLTVFICAQILIKRRR